MTSTKLFGRMTWRRAALSSTLPIVGVCILLIHSAIGEDPPFEKNGASWQDAVTYRLPEEELAKGRVARSADWLKLHRVQIVRPDLERPIQVIAWKDPTLEPENPKLLAGYLITDTLWSAKALKSFDPVASQEMERSLQLLGWSGNGLHDVLFHPLDKILHRSADLDYVHGFSLGRFPSADGRIVDLRVFRQKWDADFDVGHPRLFAEHAVYRALDDSWRGRDELARRRLLEVITDHRSEDPRDRTFWDPEAGILVDYVNFDAWLAFHDGEKPVCRHYTFKLGVLLYAIRLLGMEEEIGAPLVGMKQRLWSAQTESGGVAHFVDVQDNGTVTTGRQPTGEASAIAILSELVEARHP